MWHLTLLARTYAWHPAHTTLEGDRGQELALIGTSTAPTSLRGRLPFGLGTRGFYRDFPSDLFRYHVRDHLWGCFGLLLLLLLGILPQQYEEKHEGDQHDYDQEEGGHQRNNTTAARTLLFGTFLRAFFGTLQRKGAGRDPSKQPRPLFSP